MSSSKFTFGGCIKLSHSLGGKHCPPNMRTVNDEIPQHHSITLIFLSHPCPQPGEPMHQCGEHGPDAGCLRLSPVYFILTPSKGPRRGSLFSRLSGPVPWVLTLVLSLPPLCSLVVLENGCLSRTWECNTCSSNLLCGA